MTLPSNLLLYSTFYTVCHKHQCKWQESKQAVPLLSVLFLKIFLPHLATMWRTPKRDGERLKQHAEAAQATDKHFVWVLSGTFNWFVTSLKSFFLCPHNPLLLVLFLHTYPPLSTSFCSPISCKLNCNPSQSNFYFPEKHNSWRKNVKSYLNIICSQILCFFHFCFLSS